MSAVTPPTTTSWGVNNVGVFNNSQKSWKNNNPRYNNNMGNPGWGPNPMQPMMYAQSNMPLPSGWNNGNWNGPKQGRRNRDGTYPVCFRC